MRQTTFGGLFERTFGLFADVFFRGYLLVLVYALITAAFSLLFGLYAEWRLAGLDNYFVTEPSEVMTRKELEHAFEQTFDYLGAHLAEVVGIGLLGLAILIGLSIFQTIHTMYFVGREADEPKSPIMAGLEVARKKFWTYFAVVLLFGLVFVALTAAGGVLVLVGKVTTPLLAVIGILGLIVAYFYVFLRYIWVIPVVVFEDSSAGSAFARSSQLIAGNYGSVLGFGIVFGIVVSIGYAIVGGILTAMLTPAQSSFAGDLVMQIGNAFVSAIFGLLYVSAFVVTYRSLAADASPPTEPALDLSDPTQVSEDS